MTKYNNQQALIEQFLKDLNAIELASNSGGGILDALQTARDHIQAARIQITEAEAEELNIDDSSEAASSDGAERSDPQTSNDHLATKKEGEVATTTASSSDQPPADDQLASGNQGDIPATSTSSDQPPASETQVSTDTTADSSTAPAQEEASETVAENENPLTDSGGEGTPSTESESDSAEAEAAQASTLFESTSISPAEQPEVLPTGDNNAQLMDVA